MLLLSTSLLLEHEAVLTRPKVLSMAGLEAVDMVSVLDELASVRVPVSTDYQACPEADRPGDDPVLDAAKDLEVMSNLALRLPKELQDRAAAQAKAAGVSLNQYNATMMAYQVGTMDEVQRVFALRGARAQPGRARDVQGRAGQGNQPVTGDGIED